VNSIRTENRSRGSDNAHRVDSSTHVDNQTLKRSFPLFPRSLSETCGGDDRNRWRLKCLR
jgi:hypothetical protein